MRGNLAKVLRKKKEKDTALSKFQDERIVAVNGSMLYWFEHGQLGRRCAATEGNLPPRICLLAAA
jgi:hypothetical protein